MSDQQQGTAPAVTRLAEVGMHLEVALRALGQPNAVVHGFDFCNDSYEWRRLFSELASVWHYVFLPFQLLEAQACRTSPSVGDG